MKTLKCDLCDHEEGAKTFEEWMNKLKPHYAEAHADFMKQKGEQSKEDQMAEMRQWMEENKARFDVA
jgi:hypothetical protein